MEYRQLGNCGLTVSRVCFGALTVGPLQANLSLDEGAGLIRYALEQGINFIDTAKLYRTYPYIRKALQGWNRDVVVASKSYDYTCEGMQASLEEARQALDRDVVDIFMLHEQESELTLAGHRPALEYLEKAKARGLIKAIGVSTHTVQVVQAAAEHPEIDVIQAIVNYTGMGLLDGTAQELLAAVETAHRKGKGIYGMKPLGGGNLIRDARKALEFVFSLASLHSVAIGCRMREELDFNLAVLDGREPSIDIIRAIGRTQRRLLIEDHCIGCGRCVEKCPSGLLQVREGKAIMQKEGCLCCGYCGAVCPELAIKIV